MKIWGSKAGNPVRVAIFLEEKGIDIPFLPVDLFNLEHKSEAFLAKSPTAQVPVLELDDGTCISETIAICRYFERLQPDPPLMGVGALGEATVEMWQRRIEYQLYEPARAVFRHSAPFMAPLEPVQIGAWADFNRPKVSEGVELFDRLIGDRPFIAGDDFTMADITAAMTFVMMDFAGLEIPAACTNLARWRASLLSRPSVTAVTGAR